MIRKNSNNDNLSVSLKKNLKLRKKQVLEREKSVFEVNPNSQPDLSEYTYCIQRQLKPEARKDIVKALDDMDILPTSMIDISDGLSTEINHLSSSSDLSIHIYEDKIPIAEETKKVLADKNENVHDAMVALEEASLSFQMMLEVRNRILESYQELKRTQV